MKIALSLMIVWRRFNRKQLLSLDRLRCVVGGDSLLLFRVTTGHLTVRMVPLRWVTVITCAFLFLCHIGKGDCLVFLQGAAFIKLPYDFPVGVTFHRSHVLDERYGRTPENVLNFHIVKSTAFPVESKAGRGLFMIDEQTGSLMLSPHRRNSIAKFKGSTFALFLIAVLPNQPSEDRANATIVVTITHDNFTLPDCRPKEELCFSSAEIRYHIPETTLNGTLLGSLSPIPYSKLCGDSKTKYEIHSDGYLIASDDGNNLKTGRLFDYEEETHLEWNVSCKVISDTKTETFIARLRVFVVDVDDNPPYVQDDNDTHHDIDVNQILPKIQLPVQLTILDADSPAVNKISVNLIDPLNLFRLRNPVYFYRIKGSHMLMNSALLPKGNFHFPGITYNVSVIFNDTSLVNDFQESHVVFHIRISNTSMEMSSSEFTPKTFQVVASVFRYTSRHTRIVQPFEMKPQGGHFFCLSRIKNKVFISSSIFSVTPATGIVYVMDEVSLAKSTTKLFHLELTWRSKDVIKRRCTILLRVLDAVDPRDECGVEPGYQFRSCALHESDETCSSSCGRGANGSFCQWRSQASNNLVTKYATCSSNLRTCPDGICDELEEMDPHLCPQDCAAHVYGEGFATKFGRGVGMSAAPCFCTTPNICTCIRPFLKGKFHRSSTRSQVKELKDIQHIKYQPLELQENWGGCGTQCTTMIVVVSLIVSGLVSIAGFLMCRRWVSHSKCDDLPAVTDFINSTALPGDMGDQEHLQKQIAVNDSKLEFSRDQLVLEDILGEGEFAKVVKGKAQNISNINGTTTVAVKMLKGWKCPSIVFSYHYS